MDAKSILSCGLVDGRPLFMDEEADSYFLLEGDIEAEFLDLVRDARPLAQSASPALRAALTLAPTLASIVVADAPPGERSLLDQMGTVHARLGDALAIARLLRRVRRDISRKPISTILAALQAATGNDEVSGPVLDRARRFLAARTLVPYAPHCLRDSLALAQWLGPRSAALLVFGAKLDPFGAHCWLQLGDLLLNDRVETISLFRPVRVIRCLPDMQ